MEKIERAAIRYKGDVFDVPRPGRHHDVIRKMNKLGFDAGAMIDQGFVTNHGRYVDRDEAATIATAANQVLEGHGPDGVPFRREVTHLFSEDVW